MIAPPRAWRTTRPLAVLGTGAALPGDPIGTAALIERLASGFGLPSRRRAERLAALLGVRERHICRAFAERREGSRPGEANADLAARAVGAALADADVAVGDLDFLIAHTTTPDRLLPAGVAAVADLLGYDGPYLELRQACTGFAAALATAAGLIAADPGARVAIVGSETGSLWLDPAELGEDGQLVNLLMMGDAAAAVVLAGDGAAARIDAAWYGGIGLGRAPGIRLAHGAHRFEHDLAAVRAAGPALFAAGIATAAALGHPVEAADLIVPHQASGRTAAQLAAHLGLPPARVVGHAVRRGNTGSAAIWLALAELRSGGLAAGTRVVALGAEASKHLFGGFAYRHG